MTKTVVTAVLLILSLLFEIDLLLEIKRLERRLENILNDEGEQFEEFIKRRRD